MPRVGPVAYEDAVWIGAVDESDLATGTLRLHHADGFARARLLVRRGRAVRGFVDARVSQGSIEVAALRAAVDALPLPIDALELSRPPISVVVCTYDRPELLTSVLRSIQQLEYPDYEVVVVDNHPASGLTRKAVRDLRDRRVRVVEQPDRGISRARNAGLLAAHNDIVAFADDDVIVDKYWLQGIADGFGVGPDVACVTGNVPTGEIVSESQHYFDRRVRWAVGVDHEVFSMHAPPPDEPLFPFEIGRFGTGANFAVRRRAFIALGGFDEGLAGGEEIDMFVRVLLAGLDLVYEPAAIAWHRHRAEPAALTAQLESYGESLGAWITKLLVSPRTLPMVVRRARPALQQLRGSTEPDAADLAHVSKLELGRLERRAVRRGPWAFLRGRLAGGSGRPLRGVSVGDIPLLPGDATLPSWAVLGSILGLLAAVGVLPSPLRGLLLLAFVALGPGSAALAYWESQLATSVLRALVPVTGLAIVISALSLGLFLDVWSPRGALFGLAAATCAATGIVRRVLASRAQR